MSLSLLVRKIINEASENLPGEMWEELPEKDNQNHILRLLSELEIKVVGSNDLEKEISFPQLAKSTVGKWKDK